MIKVLHFQIHEIAPYINWLYFFHVWGFPARYGSIAKIHGCEACRNNWLSRFPTEEQARAKEAIKLYDDAMQLLREISHTIHSHAVFGLFQANSLGDDVVINTDCKQIHIPFLRQQTPGSNGMCLCISDFIRPKGKGEDQFGVFACSVDKALEISACKDDYAHMLHQTIADRLAEATAEKMHEKVRKELWGYAPDENLNTEQLFAELYQGKRPAVGYPSIPDQSMTFLIDSLLNIKQIGISLTESGAMLPHASTCGFVLSHPASIHFSVGKVNDDQLSDYAQRRGKSIEEMRKFINY